MHPLASGCQAGRQFLVAALFISCGDVKDASKSPSDSKNYSNDNSETQNGDITLAMYKKIKTGMKRKEVLSILGREGVELSNSGEAYEYIWKNSDHSNLIIMYNFGAVMTKAQYGLK